MLRLRFLGIIFILSCSQVSLSQQYKKDSAVLRQISNHVLQNYDCYKDLEQLCKQIGHRISGSPQAAEAVEWGKKTFEKIK